jgi:hypothetical protein
LKTYELVVKDGAAGIKCLRCELTSWHPKDVEQLFCGKCGFFHEGATIYPTFSCFDDAISNLVYLMKRDGGEPVRKGDVLIVHGIICPDGKDLSHGWLEYDGNVIVSGMLHGEKVMITADRSEYYEQSVVKDTTKYTLFEAYREEKRHGHFGPWVERYRALCRDAHEEKSHVAP